MQSLIEDIADGFSFCGCGKPEDAVKHVHKALQLVSDRTELIIGDGSLSSEEWDKRNTELFGSEGAMYFMWYWLENQELTEHGGSVPGWLTAKGEELLTRLNTITYA